MDVYSKPDSRSAYQAITEAQKIAFGPFIFQAVHSLVKLGILKEVELSGEAGLNAQEIAQKVDVSEYGVKVLLDMALSANVVWMKMPERKYVLDKIGHFFLNDRMTQVNLGFTADVNYAGLEQLCESITTSKPAGLHVFTDQHDTIYPIISKLPDEAKKSWFEFDHFYSDGTFQKALPIIFASKPKVILDIGGNSGKFILECLRYDKDVQMVMMDLPPQIEVARKAITEAGFVDRVTFYPCDVLNDSQAFYEGADVVWMSQFLDCFSDQQIKSILKKVATVSTSKTLVYILELFWDRQEHEAAALSLNATSLYFTALANGNSRMYHSQDFAGYVEEGGLKIIEQKDHLGIGGHSLLTCQRN